jgi:hypothetical protein
VALLGAHDTSSVRQVALAAIGASNKQNAPLVAANSQALTTAAPRAGTRLAPVGALWGLVA